MATSIVLNPGEENKASIRTKVWNYLEKSKIAQFPRPIHNRIPNFVGSDAAGNRAALLECFRNANTIKINPDKAQQQSRFLTLQCKKTLLVPTPRLQSGLFNRIIPPKYSSQKQLKTCSTSQGVKYYSSPVNLDDDIKIDLIIIGSVAVSPKGYRIGKGEGYADLEYAMMMTMGAIDEMTPVVTTVHDCQVFPDLPEHLFKPYDVTVDYIVTPTTIIKCDGNLPKPKGIIWSFMDKEKFSKIPVLKILRERDRFAGIDVKFKSD